MVFGSSDGATAAEEGRAAKQYSARVFVDYNADDDGGPISHGPGRRIAVAAGRNRTAPPAACRRPEVRPVPRPAGFPPRHFRFRSTPPHDNNTLAAGHGHLLFRAKTADTTSSCLRTRTPRADGTDEPRVENFFPAKILPKIISRVFFCFFRHK